ncbi:MAG: FMN-binding protein [Desulfotalea sp.]
MKDIYTIVFRLTLTCIMAGLVMGGTYIFTKNAKTHNEHLTEQRVSYALLGMKADSEEAKLVSLNTIYRYVGNKAGVQYIGYLLPMGESAKSPFSFVQIDLDGKLIDNSDVTIDEKEIGEEEVRQATILKVLGAGQEIRFADKIVIVSHDGKRVAYLLDGKFQGFKTFIEVMLAIDLNYTITGLEILEHEEDPGLGAEIEQPYFRNQFKEKPFSRLNALGVVKAPLPEEYLDALENNVDAQMAASVIEKYRDKDIYALTGATISSVAVTDGVKGIVKKFVYRLNILEKVIKEQKLDIAF